MVIKFTFLNMLTITFIVLKLTGYISWNWFIVLLPTIGPFFIILLSMLISIVFCLISEYLKMSRLEKKKIKDLKELRRK